MWTYLILLFVSFLIIDYLLIFKYLPNTNSQLEAESLFPTSLMVSTVIYTLITGIYSGLNGIPDNLTLFWGVIYFGYCNVLYWLSIRQRVQKLN